MALEDAFATRLLLVEDNPGDRDLILEYLSSQTIGYDTVCVASLKQAARALEEESVQVVLLDLGLPDSVGIDTLLSLRNQEPSLPIVVLTGADDPFGGIEAIKAGAQDYLIKGQFSPALLHRAIQYAVERFQLNYRLEHLNRVLRAIRNVNQLIVREHDRNRLISEVCALLIETRGYNGAWIALGNPGQPAEYIAEAGFSASFEWFRDRLTDGTWPSCVDELSARQAVTIFLQPSSDCQCPIAQAYGHSHGAVCLLAGGGKRYGYLGVSLASLPEETDDESSLLDEIAGDIGFALHKLEIEQQQEQTEKYYQRLFQNMQQGAVYQDAQGRILEANPAALRIFGVSGHTLKKRDWLSPEWGFIGDDGQELPVSSHPVKKAWKSGQQESGVLGIYNPETETYRWLRIHAVPEYFGGAIARVLATMEDITDLRRSQENLAEKELHYRSLVMQSADCLILHDFSGQIHDVNQSSCRTYGYSRDELLEMNVADLAPDYRSRPENGHFYHQMVAGVPRSFQARQRKKDGTEFPAEVRLTLLEYGGKKLVQGLCRDISDQVEAEKRLERQGQFLQILIDAIPISVFYKDLQGTYLGCNNAYASFLGRSKEQIVGCGVFELFPPEDARLYHQKDVDLLEYPGIQQYEGRMVNGDGISRDVLFNKATFKDNDGALAGIIGAMLDVTERKDLEKRLLRSQKMESIGTLAGGIAHDFNNLLTSIIGFTELSLDGAERGSELEGDLEEIRRAGLRAKELVRQILTFARQSEEELRHIQPLPIIKEVVKLLRSTIPSNIEIHQNLGSDSYVMANVSRLHQVLMNLCTNAAYAMEEKGGQLTLGIRDVELRLPSLDPGSGSVSQLFLELTVADTGTGIPKEIIDSIFEPYFTTKKFGEGTGLGLAVVHGIVESLEGSISVSSREGEGTIFRVLLPVSPGPEKELLLKADTVLTGQERIMFVDDEKTIVKIAGRVLEKLGYAVTVHNSSTKALRAIESEPDGFDLLITDMNMPVMTGLDLSKRAKSLYPDLPIILCTGYSKVITNESVAEAGITRLFYKPIEKQQLAQVVREVLDEADKRKH